MDFFEDLFDLDDRRKNRRGHHDGHSGHRHDDFDDDHGFFNGDCHDRDDRMGSQPFCPQCSSPVSPGAKFCQNCGAGLRASAVCGSCGTKAAANASFCPECGNMLR